MDLLHELWYCKNIKAFRRYAWSYKVQIIDLTDPLLQLEANKSNIEDLFQDLLNQIKVFKYQITVIVLLSKHKENEHIVFAPVYFNSITKTIINSKYDFGNPTHNWINWLIQFVIELAKGLVG